MSSHPMPHPPRFFLLHIPKTAGVSLIHAFQAVLPPDAHATFIDGLPAADRVHLGDKQFLSGHVFYDEMASLPFIHRFKTIAFFRDPYAQIASNLRWLDHYTQPDYRHERDGFPDDVKDMIDRVGATDFSDPDALAQLLATLTPRGVMDLDNQQTRYLTAARDPAFPGFPFREPLPLSAIDLLKERLDTIDFVGLTAHFSAAVALLNARYGLALPCHEAAANVSPSLRALDWRDPAIRAVLKARIEVDLLAYEHVLARVRREDAAD